MSYSAVDGMESFAEEYGHSDGYSLSDVFWTCSNMLSDRYGNVRICDCMCVLVSYPDRLKIEGEMVWRIEWSECRSAE